MEVSICRPMVPASPLPLVGAQSFPVGSTGTERDLAPPLQHCRHTAPACAMAGHPQQSRVGTAAWGHGSLQLILVRYTSKSLSFRVWAPFTSLNVDTSDCKGGGVGGVTETSSLQQVPCYVCPCPAAGHPRVAGEWVPCSSPMSYLARTSLQQLHCHPSWSQPHPSATPSPILLPLPLPADMPLQQHVENQCHLTFN